jgi:MFS family permease
MGVMLLFLKNTKKTPPSPSGSSSFFKGLKDAYLKKPILVLTMVHCVIDFRLGALSFIPTYLVKEVGFDLQTSASLYMLLLIGSAVGSILWGVVSDKLGKKHVIIGALGVSALMVYILPLLNSIYPLAILLLTLGLTFQTVSPLVQALLADFTKQEDIGQVFGIFYTIAFTLGLVGPLLFGYITDLFDFKAAFTYVAAVTLIAIVPARLIPKRQ